VGAPTAMFGPEVVFRWQVAQPSCRCRDIRAVPRRRVLSAARARQFKRYQKEKVTNRSSDEPRVAQASMIPLKRQRCSLCSAARGWWASQVSS